MRYIYQEPVITTITDDELTDESAILDLVKSIKEQQHNVSIHFEDPDTHFIHVCEAARITAIDEANKTINLHVFYSGASMKYALVPVSSLRKIRLVASRQQLSEKYKVTRWHHMEVAEVDGI
jgi:hypothetical protein